MANDVHNPNDRDALVRDAWRRLTRLEIEAHRIKAMLARVEAMDQDRAADELARLLAEYPDDLAFASALTSYVDDPSRAARSGDRPVPPDSAARSREPASRHGESIGHAPTGKPSPQPPPPATPLIRVDPAHGSDPPRPHAPPPCGTPAGRPARVAVQADGVSTAQGSAKDRPAWRASPPWVTSVVAHLLTLLVLGLITIATLQEEEPWLAASMGDSYEVAVTELSEIEIAPPDLAVDAESAAPLEAALSDLTARSPLGVASEPASLPQSAIGDYAFTEVPLGTAGLLDASATGESPGGSGNGDEAGPPTSSFFGAEARANRIVYIVDNSNSMDEGRFETALMELAQSVGGLSPQQSFYVIFYSDTAYRLFHPQSEDALVPATHENKLRLREWLSSVEMCVGGRLVDAVRIASELDPQVVYLLSDGVISEFPVSYLTEGREWSFTVHTIGMTVPDQRAAQNLMAIAAANGGAFRPVGVTPLAAEMARRRPIKKNRTRGRVWGVKLPVAGQN